MCNNKIICTYFNITCRGFLQARLRSGQRYCDSRLYTKMCSPKHQHCRHVRQCGPVPKGSQVAQTNNRLERDQRRRTVPVPQYRSGNIFLLLYTFRRAQMTTKKNLYIHIYTIIHNDGSGSQGMCRRKRIET